MITVKRSTNEINNYSDYTANGGVALLERTEEKTYADFETNESLEQAKERMQRNLDKILNYDKYVTEEVDIATETKVEEKVATVIENQCDEDFRPTSTTMQFGDGDIQQMKNEMRSEESSSHTGYHLNAKGKMVVLLYALAMAVIMTLIIINTGILARLGSANEAKIQTVQAKMSQLESINEQIENVSDSDYTINYAENVLGMVK